MLANLRRKEEKEKGNEGKWEGRGSLEMKKMTGVNNIQMEGRGRDNEEGI